MYIAKIYNLVGKPSRRERKRESIPGLNARNRSVSLLEREGEEDVGEQGRGREK